MTRRENDKYIYIYDKKRENRHKMAHSLEYNDFHFSNTNNLLLGMGEACKKKEAYYFLIFISRQIKFILVLLKININIVTIF